MSELSDKILNYLETSHPVDTLKLASTFEEDHQKVIGAINSLLALDDIITAENVSSKRWELTEEGKLVCDKGSYEVHLFNAIPSEGINQKQIMADVPNSKVGFAKAMSKGWILYDKSTNLVTRKVDSVVDEVQADLKSIQDGKSEAVTDSNKQDYKKRKLILEVTVKSFLVNKGKNFTTTIEKPEADLTHDMIMSGSWKAKTFKPYNFDALGVVPPSGHLHPLMKVRQEFRQIFLEMGFSEMPTNNYVESSFWNFDALFQPQQHPARDAHDTFFISDPATSDKYPAKYAERVCRVHSKGGYGSQGYGYKWSKDEAQKNLLRTHTTAVSARMLYALAQKEFKPVKYFSIDKVFRNETLDATHLAEFHQVEGVIADVDLSLGHLIGVLDEFFKKLGITQLQFKPAYNPYTEPSMEIFCFHPGLNKWIEVGNSGIFRPEMLLPMNLPGNVNVIAWGLSLERPTMIKYHINNIRDLVGPKVDLKMVENNPICRLDK
nr:PREDICTED: phenylalanine--tRNA ligase alpha subunit [Bemisia tabaci]